MDYAILHNQLRDLIRDVPYRTANLANASALLWQYLDNVNWAGFYMLDGDTLVLGPFQGKPACIEIPVGRGVCGTAVVQSKTIRVADVHSFPGHIACDSASKSEIVIPIRKDGQIIGVLDIDSPVANRFTVDDQSFLEKFVEILSEAL
jgi:GAF domain-containing protein